MIKIKSIKDCFDNDGNFIICDFDPYRVPDNDRDKKALHDILFDEEGYAVWEYEVVDLINRHKWSWDCDAVKYFYARHCIDSNCKGNYTAVYAWRH